MKPAIQTDGRSNRGSPLSAAERSNRWAGITALLALLLYAFLVDPEKVHLFECAFKDLTGKNCFACGLTHSLHAAAHLHWGLAVKYHLFGPPLLFAATTILLCWFWELMSGQKVAVRIRAGYWKTGAIFTCLVWLFYWLSRLSSPISGISS